MKTIIMVRHAKSSWKDPNLDDFDRPLNKRGEKNAAFMGNKLKEKQIMPDLILSSPAKRAKETAFKIAKEIGYPKKKIVFDENMYHSDERYLLELVQNQDNTHETLMLFGHNPDFNNFATMLLKQSPLSNIPTSGVCCIRFDVASWKKVREAEGEVVFFDYPKRYADE
ncbi:MAG: histidine phosphatase family protein [Desulfobacterales bacterium]|uniref:Histidine phosphatase family protein n=1 Tax=Candidatus Desulfatibia profunda TaxID=2841695 RepID=A0A8J6TMM2_9BACT|nr:histidine phosphatase family protein [Candidatus Desulfatibia profunda]MBL7179464.1 histidine phosphatase family protein [Desulfobacterales bacterium]